MLGQWCFELKSPWYYSTNPELLPSFSIMFDIRIDGQKKSAAYLIFLTTYKVLLSTYLPTQKEHINVY